MEKGRYTDVAGLVVVVVIKFLLVVLSAATLGSEQTMDTKLNNFQTLLPITHQKSDVHYYRQARYALTKYTNSFITGVTMSAQCNSCHSSHHSTSPTMFLVRSATKGTEPGLLCARRLASLQEQATATHRFSLQQLSTYCLDKLCYRVRTR